MAIDPSRAIRRSRRSRALRPDSGRAQAQALVICALAVIASTPWAGCGDTGTVAVRFVVPDDPRLSPLGESLQIAEVALVRTAPGEPPTRILREVTQRGEEIEIGDIAPGEGLRLAVELRSTTQRLVGYGRSEVVDIRLGESIEVPVHLRRPFLYLSGDTSITTFDATGEADAGPFLADIDGIAAPEAVAAAPNGAHLFTVAPGDAMWALARIATLDHASIEPDSVPLTRRPSGLAVSSDGRFAVVGHPDDGTAGGVTIVHLEAAGAGAATFVELGNVTDVALSRAGQAEPRAYALIDGHRDCQDGPTSSIVALSLTEPGGIEFVFTGPTPIADLAVLDDDSLAVALPCSDELARVDRDGVASAPLARVERVTTVAMAGNRLWSMGTRPPDQSLGRRFILSSFEPATGETSAVELRPAQERVVSPGGSDSGHEVIRQMAADDAAAFDLIALPGGDYVAALTFALYEAEPQGDSGIPGVPLLSGLSLTSWEYALIEAGTGRLVQRVRTSCDLEVGNGVFDDWACTLSGGQDETERAYVPLGLAALYGER